MNIRQAKNEIKHTVEAYLKKDEAGDYEIPEIRQRPVLLMGPPGIGKTQIMEQIARELGVGLVAYTITHHTRQSAVGLPFIREEEFAGKTYSVTEYTMSEIIASVYRRIRDSGQQEGILFIDEINCVSETLAPTMLQFLQCKTFGNQKIPEGWVIVAAGNPPEYNKSVRDFDMVTLDRVRYMTVEADYRVWKEYARAQHISGAILSYLELRPGNFYRVEADVDGMQFVTARGWEDLSNLMAVYEKLGFLVDEQVIREYIHHADVAEDVAAYLDLYRKYQDDYGIPQILDGCVRPEIYARIYAAAFDERLSVVHLLLVKHIIGLMKARKSLSMFSATISREVMDIGWMYQKDAEEITVQPKEESQPKITQYMLETSGRNKLSDLAQIIIGEGYKRVMVFCDTKFNTAALANQLARLGFSVDCLHGDLSQNERNRIMQNFRDGKLNVLVATDVAARGIDVSDVDAVINYPDRCAHISYA